jgi:hypothetical protein
MSRTRAESASKESELKATNQEQGEEEYVTNHSDQSGESGRQSSH